MYDLTVYEFVAILLTGNAGPDSDNMDITDAHIEVTEDDSL